ncbi:heptaprenyl diphosphate synthase component 1 [Planococcus salinus]|uniref:Heptaprenyl diphosphate synthase n=1 Tax=Planococcus salinus TaxID=1848460 RepID=A0A3M8P9W8_9BACL|nr:heptaprenyl diphosphate synthase component 1 [Planococcus salinus]RNF40505.1 heptaprenyl diphosphate synthase [Planococcus salinus]
MNEQQIHSKIRLMESDVKNAVRQRTLETCTGGPSIERTRLFFLLLPLFTGKPWSGEIEASAKTVSIVYAALHAHDQVKEVATTKKQQLTVLAGDFYSGIYYQMLANLNNFTLIQRLATAITKVSEQKTSFYETVIRSEEEIERSVQIIESDLLTTFYRYYGYEEYAQLAEVSLQYVRYSEELAYWEAGVHTQLLKTLYHSLQPAASIETWLMEKLDQLEEEMLELVNHHLLPYDLKNYLLHKITPHQHRAEQLTREG